MGNLPHAQGAAGLAGAFMAAPLSDDGWDAALKALARETNSARGQIVAYGVDHETAFNWVTDVDPGGLDPYEAIGGGRPDVNWRATAAGAPMAVIGEEKYRAAAATLKTDIYQDFVEWFGCQFGCQTTLYQDSSRLLGLAVLRDRKDGLTTHADRDLFAAVAPHALNAVRMQRSLEHQGARLVAGALEAMDAAVFVCDGAGQVVALTGPAEARLRAGATLKLARGALSAVAAKADPEFQRLLRTAVMGEPHDQSLRAPLWLPCADSPHTGEICEIFPLPARPWGLAFEPRALVVLRDLRDPAAARRGLLRQAFSLTAAESDVAALIAAGLSREEIAARRSATLNTVASQFKSIFAKTDVTREAELVALLNRVLR